MNTCSCGHILNENDMVCPNCGKAVNSEPQIKPAAPLGAAPVGTPINAQKKSEQPEPVAKPISALFENPPVEKAAPVRVRPEVPRASDKVEVKPMANPSQGGIKLNPLKNPPPVESVYSVLNTATTIANVFIMMIPLVGFVYAIILTIAAKKYNTRVLAVSYLAVMLIFIVVLAVAALVLSFLFENVFNEICSIIDGVLNAMRDII